MAPDQNPGYLIDPEPGVLVLRGDDAGEFLNGQVSNDVSALTDGESKYALLLTPKGKLRADMTIAKDGDETLIITTKELLPIIQHTINTFRIGYFFSAEDATGEFALVRVVSDQPEELADGLTIPVVELSSPLGIDLLVETQELNALTQELDAASASQLTTEEFNSARIAAGVPAFPVELNEDTFPAEAGLEERAVSFEKGCYVGQETVARMHYKGKPNRHLRILQAAQPLTPGAEVTANDGRALGAVGTTTTNPDQTSSALAVLRREADIGEVVDAGGIAATIVEIPKPSQT